MIGKFYDRHFLALIHGSKRITEFPLLSPLPPKKIECRPNTLTGKRNAHYFVNDFSVAPPAARGIRQGLDLFLQKRIANTHKTGSMSWICWFEYASLFPPTVQNTTDQKTSYDMRKEGAWIRKTHDVENSIHQQVINSFEKPCMCSYVIEMFQCSTCSDIWPVQGQTWEGVGW